MKIKLNTVENLEFVYSLFKSVNTPQSSGFLTLAFDILKSVRLFTAYLLILSLWNCDLLAWSTSRYLQADTSGIPTLISAKFVQAPARFILTISHICSASLLPSWGFPKTTEATKRYLGLCTCAEQNTSEGELTLLGFTLNSGREEQMVNATSASCLLS